MRVRLIPDEDWRPVVGFEGLYEVSRCGQVRSLSTLRQHGGYRPRIIPGKLLKPKAGHKYAIVSLWDASGKDHHRSIHRLVAEAFVPNPTGARLVRHKDDQPRNNWAENLLWGSHADNTKDAQLNERLGRKLELVDARAILTLAGTKSNRAIALEYGVHESTVGKIIKRKGWSHAESY